MISFPCPTCGRKLKAEPELAGRKVKCKKCGQAIIVPGDTVIQPSPAQAQRSAPSPSHHDEPDEPQAKGRSLIRTLRRLAETALALSIIGGLVGDFLRPMEAFNFYALVTFSGLAVLFLLFSLNRRRVALTCFFFICLATGFGGWWAVAEFKGGKTKGFLAEHIGVVESLQSSVLTRIKRELAEAANEPGKKPPSELLAKPGGPASINSDERNPLLTSEENLGATEKVVPSAAGKSPKKTEQPSSVQKVEGDVEVIAEGVGSTPDEALKDAFRNSVRQVVGAVVDAETIVKNDEVISDKVLTYSDGFIRKFEEIGNQNGKGLFHVKIAATVERRSVLAKLQEANVTLKAAEGKDIAATALTRKEARENATALINKALGELPKVLVAEARKPSARDFDEDTSILTMDITVRSDEEKYTTFVKGFVELADKVCLENRSQLLIATDLPTYSNSNEGYAFERLSFNEEKIKRHPKGWVLSILTDGKGQRFRWNVYLLDSNPYKSLSALSGKVTVGVSLLDKDGKRIEEDEFDPAKTEDILGDKDLQGRGGYIYSQGVFWLGSVRSTRYANGMRYCDLKSDSNPFDKNGMTEATISHLPHNAFHQFRSPALTYQRRLKISEKDLARVQDIKCSVTFHPAKEHEEK